MSQVMDRPVTEGSTLYPRVTPIPEMQDAEDFYQRGVHGGARREVTIWATGPDGSTRSTWLASYMESQINGLLRLGHGWDGDRANPVSNEAVLAVVDLMSRFATELFLPPLVFPLADGGLQLEWHADRQSVEVEVDGTGDAHVLATDESGHIVLNTELNGDAANSLAQAQQAVEQLSMRLLRAR